MPRRVLIYIRVIDDALVVGFQVVEQVTLSPAMKKIVEKQRSQLQVLKMSEICGILITVVKKVKLKLCRSADYIDIKSMWRAINFRCSTLDAFLLRLKVEPILSRLHSFQNSARYIHVNMDKKW